MQRICSLTKKPFNISPAEIEYCGNNNIPLPSLSPLVRFRNMLVFRNRSDLYHAKCCFTEKQILSAIAPELNLKVADIDAWNSDCWDPLDYGRDYDFSKPFFSQFAALLQEIPYANLAIMKSSMENSDYTNGITGAKNCYLLFACNYCEDCLYSKNLTKCKNVIDSNMAYYSELCYSCNNVTNCYNLKYSEDSFHCSDSYFLYNCQSCSNCYGCFNLTNKQYYFENKPLSKTEYIKRIESLNLGSFEFVANEQDKYNSSKKNYPIKYFFGKNAENSSGNFLTNVKNCWDSYFLTDCEDMNNCLWVFQGKSAIFQCTYGLNTELVYNSVTVGDNSYNIKFCAETWDGVSDLEYCMFCVRGASNSFSSVGLKKNSYCILNKQYTKDEYLNLLGRIKKQMMQNGEYGQFFPVNFSPYYFNHSEAYYYLPLDKSAAIAQGFKWKEEEVGNAIQHYKIPDNIRDVRDDILDQVLICAVSGRKYKIINSELEYYRKHNIPVPIIAPIERIKTKAKILELSDLKNIFCASCGSDIRSVYESGSNIVYCEKCFQQSVY